MTDANPADDLAYVRALAEQGRQAPLLGGRFHLWWGAWTATAWFAHGAILSGLIPVNMRWLWAVWLCYGIVGAAVQELLARGLRDKPGAGALGNVVERLVWPTAMGGLGAFVAGIILAVAFAGAPWRFVDLIAPAAFVGYGIAFMMTGLLSGAGWLKIPALACFAAAVALPSLAGTATLYGVAGVGILVLSGATGFALLRNEPKAG